MLKAEKTWRVFDISVVIRYNQNKISWISRKLFRLFYIMRKKNREDLMYRFIDKERENNGKAESLHRGDWRNVRGNLVRSWLI